MSSLEPKLVHFRVSEGSAVTRFGTGTLLGCKLDPETKKIVWSGDVVAISEYEYRRYQKEYDRAVRMGDLERAEAPAAAAVDKPEAQVAEQPETQARTRRRLASRADGGAKESD